MSRRHVNRNPDFQHGPYRAPDVKLGDMVRCAVNGWVEVRAFHDKGSIAAPKGRVAAKNYSILVTDDLERALRVETSYAICFHWRVAEPTVARWRKALGIDSRSTESFLRASRLVGSITGNLPGTADRLRDQNERPWTPEELALVPKLTAAELVRRTGRSKPAIEHVRTRRGLWQVRPQLTCPHCGYTWKPDTDRMPKRCAGPSCRRRLEL